jgi:hypothetical protein
MDLGRDPCRVFGREHRPKRVKSDAYGYASKGLYSHQIEKLNRIDRFGLKAITGRDVFYHGELQQLIAAENVVIAYTSRKSSENWGEWENKYPSLAKILIEIETQNAASIS